MCRIDSQSQFGCSPQQCRPGYPGYYPSVEVEKEKKDAVKTWQDARVKELALPEMVKTFLIKSNIKKVEEIEKKSDEDLLDVKGIGEKALKLIRGAVRKLK